MQPQSELRQDNSYQVNLKAIDGYKDPKSSAEMVLREMDETEMDLDDVSTSICICYIGCISKLS
jgi:hypothetical protein